MLVSLYNTNWFSEFDAGMTLVYGSGNVLLGTVSLSTHIQTIVSTLFVILIYLLTYETFHKMIPISLCIHVQYFLQRIHYCMCFDRASNVFSNGSHGRILTHKRE